VSAVVGNAALAAFDVLVIGSGAGGAAAAHMLTKAGRNVLVLEAGPNQFAGLDDPAPGRPSPRFSNDEVKQRKRGFLDADVLVDPRTFRRREADGARTFVGDVNALPKTVGGGAVHADLKMPRFIPADFRLGSAMRPVHGAAFADWPVDYDALERFYLYAEQVGGVAGVAGASPFDPPRSGPYPMPPGVPMYVALRAAEGAAALGYHPYPYPTGVNSQPYDNRPPCVDCGFCGGYGCPINAKGSPAVTTLRKALLSGRCQLRPETRAVRLRLGPTGSEVVGVDALGPRGEPLTFTADCYVLAASPIEDARLCLLSDPGGPGVGNSSGLVGRNLMFHLQTIAIGVLEERLHGHRGRSVTHAVTDFRGVPDDPRRPLGGIVELGAAEGPISEALNYARDLGQHGAPLKSLIRQSPFRDHFMVLTMQAEDAPQPSNRVDLDPEVRDLDALPVARVTYQSHPWELAARAFYAPKLLDVVQAAGARWAFIAPADTVPSSRHIMGTLRFGEDPAASVCDPTGRFHDVGNLWAADGALFPTSSGFNPTLTIVALGLRVGAGIAYPGDPDRALT
jgi:choline dehydrogenase-like flavoprotein